MEIIDSEIRTDLLLCLHALVDALEAKGALTERDFVEAAQETLLRRCAGRPTAEVPGLLVLKTIAALYECGAETWPEQL